MSEHVADRDRADTGLGVGGLTAVLDVAGGDEVKRRRLRGARRGAPGDLRHGAREGIGLKAAVEAGGQFRGIVEGDQAVVEGRPRLETGDAVRYRYRGGAGRDGPAERLDR